MVYFAIRSALLCSKPPDPTNNYKANSETSVINMWSYLVTVKAIEQCDTDDSSTNAGMVGERSKGQGFHFHVENIIIMDLV